MFTQARATFYPLTSIFQQYMIYISKRRTAALQKFCQFNFMCGVQCAGDGNSGGGISCVQLKQKNCVFHKWKT